MRIGDKVRFLKGKEEGIVRKISGTIVDVEIEDGFIIPMHHNEVVLVSKQENELVRSRMFEEQRPGKPAQSFAEAPIFKKDKGIYFAFVPFNDQVLSLFIINDTSGEVAVSLFQEKNNIQEGLVISHLAAEKAEKVTELRIDRFEEWPTFYIQVLYFSYGKTKIQQPLNKKIALKAKSFFKSKKQAPVIDKDAYLVRLDEENIVFKPEEIKESIITNQAKAEERINMEVPAHEVDLHIEKLSSNSAEMTGTQILHLQMQIFQTSLDKAIAGGLDEIIFIHGVGNGVLKTEIQKLLSRNKNIKFYKDAQKEKFGYGATLVRLK